MYFGVRLVHAYIKWWFFSNFLPNLPPNIGLKRFFCQVLFDCLIGFWISFIFWEICKSSKRISGKSELHHAYSRHAYKKNMYIIRNYSFATLLCIWNLNIYYLEKYILTNIIISENKVTINSLLTFRTFSGIW